MDIIRKISRDWVVIFCLFVTMSVVISTGIRAQKIGEQNQRFLSNFSDYMSCLVVSDPEVVKALGKEIYFNECDKLLYRGTGQHPGPRTKVTVPPTTTTS